MNKKGFGGFILIAVGLIVILIVAVIAQTIYTASSGNFTGINLTMVGYFVTFLLLGAMVYIAVSGLRTAGLAV